jgi:hypothetical protein
MLDNLQRDMVAAIEQMPPEWDEVELGWYLVHCAEMFSEHHFVHRIRRKAFENGAGTTGLSQGPRSSRARKGVR